MALTGLSTLPLQKETTDAKRKPKKLTIGQRLAQSTEPNKRGRHATGQIFQR